MKRKNVLTVLTLALIACVSANMSGELLAHIRMGDTLLIATFEKCTTNTSNDVWFVNCAKVLGYDVDNGWVTFEQSLEVYSSNRTFNMIIGGSNVWPASKEVVWQHFILVERFVDSLNFTIVRPFDMMAIRMLNGTITLTK